MVGPAGRTTMQQAEDSAVILHDRSVVIDVVHEACAVWAASGSQRQRVAMVWGTECGGGSVCVPDARKIRQGCRRDLDGSRFQESPAVVSPDSRH